MWARPGRIDRTARSTAWPLLSGACFWAALALLMVLAADVEAAGAPAPDAGLAGATVEPAARSPKGFKICHDQTYALCAVASCFVLNQVAYCKCDVKSGDSISLPFRFDKGEDVCSINAEGARNGYMVSTFSLPSEVVAPGGDMALYTCPAATSDGAYAQCDGGVCFTSTEGGSFPGFDRPLAKNEIICSCPITVADPTKAKLGFQIAGPYPCEKSFFANCKGAKANTKTGATIYVGAPTGTPRLLTRLLNGSVPKLNICSLPGTPG
jgi:hypothetical protein